MNQRASETYKHLILDVAEVKTFVKLYNAGKLPVDLIKEKVDEKIQQVIDMKFKMARGNDVKRSEEREVQRLFRKLVHIKDESALVVPRREIY